MKRINHQEDGYAWRPVTGGLAALVIFVFTSHWVGVPWTKGLLPYTWRAPLLAPHADVIGLISADVLVVIVALVALLWAFFGSPR